MTTAALATITTPVDASDPLVVVVSWVLTLVAGKLLNTTERRKFRKALPALAFLFAVAIRAGVDVAQGHPLDLQTLLRALAAGGIAVAGHSQFREVAKMLEAPPLDPPSSPTGGD